MIVALAGLAVPAWGQEVTAAVTGSVLDPSGAPVMGASVTAIDVERGVTYPVKTNEQGIYHLLRIPVGKYKLTVEAKGFQKANYPPFTLVLNQTARIDISMKIGAQSETVEVTGAAPLLQTDSTQMSTVLDAQIDSALPLATRNYVQLTLLTPGAVTPDPASLTTGQDMTSQGRPYINGNREQDNNFMLDGVDNSEFGDNEIGYSPSVDAVQEFNLISQNASAEFGNFQGGIVSTTIKSGTNTFHGDVFEFFRNDVLNANAWQNGFINQATGQPLPINKVRWNMFGFTFGGPVIKNRLFFFSDYQGQRYDYPKSTTFYEIIPTQYQTGDLSYLCPEGFSGGVCVNPAHQIYDPSNVVGGARQPFANNQIPSGRIDTVVKNLFASKFYPQVSSTASENNYAGGYNQKFDNDQGDIKVDYNVSSRDRLYGRWSQMHLTEPYNTSYALATTNSGNMTTEPAQNFGLTWTHQITQAIINEARTGFNHVHFIQNNSANGVGNLAQELGIANGNTAGAGMTYLNIGSGYSGVGSIGVLQNFGDTVIQAGDTVLITKGRHLLHTGFQFYRYRMNSAYAGNSGIWGEIDFGDNWTTSSSGVGGASIADFLLGLPYEVQKGGAKGWEQLASLFSGFVQDDWRITDELTLNLGLRYENHTNWKEKNNNEVNFGKFSGNIEFAGQNGNSDSLYNSYNAGADFQPRIGLAYSPKALHNKTVFRGAYTLSSYTEGMGSNNRLPQNIPFVPGETVQQYSSNGTNLPGSTLDQGFPAQLAGGTYNGVTDYAGSAIRLWDPNWRPAVSQQWNFSVQQQLTNSMTLTLGYAGEHGTHLTNFYWANQKILNADGTTSPGPYVAGNPTLKNEIGAIRMTLSNGGAEYKAFQALLDKRFSNGLQGQLAYTLSKCETDATGFYGNWNASQTDIGMPSPQDIYNPHGDWGRCNFDAMHVLNGFANYALPFGKGKTYGSHMNPIANAVVGNWEVSGILSVHSGFAMNFVDGWVDPAGVGSFMERPNVTGHVNYPKKTFVDPTSGLAIGKLWVDPSAFTQAPQGSFGDEKVGDLRGPGLANIDFSVHKSIPFNERCRAELRVETMNLFNHPILYIGAANMYLNQGEQSGLITQSKGERQTQLALKVYF
jgi:hypothetical protein